MTRDSLLLGGLAMRAAVVRFVACIAGLVVPGNAFSQVQTDVLFLVDGSETVQLCLFEFEKEAIGTLLCGSACDPCSSANIPQDGTIAVGVLQFAGNISPGGVRTEVALTIIDSAATGASICDHVRGHDGDDMFRRGGSTPLASALTAARAEFEAHGHPGARRVVILLSDVKWSFYGEQYLNMVLLAAEDLRTICGNPSRISSFRFSDSPIDDPPCSDPPQQEDQLLVQIANTPRSDTFDPTQTIGLFDCAELCPSGQCGTPPNNCHYTSADVQTFVALARETICSLGLNDVTITQQTQQSPGNPVSLGADVTFTIQAATNGTYLFYQWMREGSVLSGETGTTLTLSDVGLFDAGNYRCIVWTPCDQEVSQTASMLVALGEAEDCNGDDIADACQLAPLYGWTA